MKHDIHVAVLIVGCGRLEVRLSHGATARKAARRTGRPDASSVALERAVAVWFRPATRRTRPRRKRRCGVHLTPRLAPAKGRWQAPTQVRPSSRSVRDEATLFVLRGTGIQSGRCSAINVDALRAIKRGYQRLQRRSDINTPSIRSTLFYVNADCCIRSWIGVRVHAAFASSSRVSSPGVRGALGQRGSILAILYAGPSLSWRPWNLSSKMDLTRWYGVYRVMFSSSILPRIFKAATSSACPSCPQRAQCCASSF